MKAKRTVGTVVVIVGTWMGFWFYNIGRTMRESVNFDVSAIFCGLMLVVLFSMIPVMSLFILKSIFPSQTKWSLFSLLILFSVSLGSGSLLSEAMLLRDEARFAAEVMRANPQSIYSRPRAWPNQNCDLVFIPGKGIHSTD